MDTIFTIIYGIFTLGILILVHEFGHFIAGKLTGIRVTGFSIGFGRGIISFTHKGTLYKLGWLPVGGYCRFAGEGEDLSDDRKGEPDEFYERPAWARLITVSAGVIFNFIFGFFIYWLLSLLGSSYVDAKPEVTVFDRKLQKFYGKSFARRRPGLPALTAGMQHGDHILSINGKKVSSFREMSLEVMSSGNETVRFLIRRNGRLFSKNVVIGLSRRTAGYLNVAPWAPPVLAVVCTRGAAWKSGLRPGDYIHAVDGEKIANSYLDLFRVLKQVAAATNTTRKIRIDYSRYSERPAVVNIERKKLASAVLPADEGIESKVGFRVCSPASVPGIKNGDFFISLNGKKIFDYLTFRAYLQELTKKTVSIRTVRGNPGGFFPGGEGVERTLPIALLKTFRPYNPPLVIGVQEAGALYRAGLRNRDIIIALNGGKLFTAASLSGKQHSTRSSGKVRVQVLRSRRATLELMLPAGSSSTGVLTSPDRYIFTTPSRGVIDAAGFAAGDFLASFSRIVKGLTKLFHKGVDIRESAGGPITLVGLSGKILKERSFRSWLELLSLLSIAIGFMNLLPIPALDGGHIILNIVELIRRKRMSFKVLQRIQLIGITILFSLFVVIIFLDVMKLDTIF